MKTFFPFCFLSVSLFSVEVGKRIYYFYSYFCLHILISVFIFLFLFLYSYLCTYIPICVLLLLSLYLFLSRYFFYVATPLLSGHGLITARGGNGTIGTGTGVGGGGGSGGRIALYGDPRYFIKMHLSSKISSFKYANVYFHLKIHAFTPQTICLLIS